MLQQLLDYYVPELEALKLRLTLKNGADSSQWLQQPRSHDPNAVQISTSNLEQLDWGGLTSQPSLEPAKSGGSGLLTAPTDLLSGHQQPGTRSASQAYSAGERSGGEVLGLASRVTADVGFVGGA